jgi:hypothetical protein
MPSAFPTPDYEFSKVELQALRVKQEYTYNSQGRRVFRLLQVDQQNETFCVEFWKRSINERMFDEVRAIIGFYETLEVNTVNVYRRMITDPGDPTRDSSFVFEYDVFMAIRSPVQGHNLRRYVEGPFDTPRERLDLISELNSTTCEEYHNIADFRLTFEEATYPELQSQNNSSGSNSQTSIIAGVFASVTAIILLIAGVLFNRVQNRKDQIRLTGDESSVVEDSETHDIIEKMDQSSRQITYEYMSEVGVQTVRDVSTLGDPIPIGVHASRGDQSTISGSISLDYDFQRAFREHPSVSVAETGSGSSSCRSGLVLRDEEDTFEAQYTGADHYRVEAPSGVLGLVLETNHDGVPTVNNVKPASVLASQVRIGDRLLFVDGRDVTVMLASDVSKLIASKKEQSTRQLIFERSRHLLRSCE